MDLARKPNLTEENLKGKIFTQAILTILFSSLGNYFSSTKSTYVKWRRGTRPETDFQTLEEFRSILQYMLETWWCFNIPHIFAYSRQRISHACLHKWQMIFTLYRCSHRDLFFTKGQTGLAKCSSHSPCIIYGFCQYLVLWRATCYPAYSPISLMTQICTSLPAISNLTMLVCHLTKVFLSS